MGACLPSESASSPPLLIAGRRRLGAVAGQPLAAAPCQAGRQCRLLDRARRKPRRAAARATSRPPVTRPPWNSSVSPALISTASESACSASVPGRAARPRPPRYRTGFLASNAAGAISCGAHVPPVRSGRGWVSTSPPEAQSWTAAPTAVTTRPPRHPRHRRRNADIPPALTDDLVQVADACSRTAIGDSSSANRRGFGCSMSETGPPMLTIPAPRITGISRRYGRRPMRLNSGILGGGGAYQVLCVSRHWDLPVGRERAD